MLTFFYSTQTCSTATHIALEELEIPFEGIEVSWKRKLNVAELEKISPLGQVPALVIEGKPFTQTIAILEYLANQKPDKDLFPKRDHKDYSKALEWLSFIGADFQKNFIPLVYAQRWTDDKNTQNKIQNSTIEKIQKHLDYIDSSLRNNDYLLGSKYSLVDSYLFTILGWCKWANLSLSAYKNIIPYMNRIYQRPAVHKVLEKEDLLDFISK
ncbi:MAG: glutathione S-transferase family protein [Oligoflexia bacterium]|nr:glutathione S-transferase family protein [Oligoflexia bacterium]